MDHPHLSALQRMGVLIIPLLILLGCGPASSPAQPIDLPTAVNATAAETPVQIPSPAQSTALPAQPGVPTSETPVQAPTPEDLGTPVSQPETPDVQAEKTVGPGGNPRPLPSSVGMVKIEGGSYTLGGTNPDPFHVEFLTQGTPLATFWIDATEVTNAAYQEFVDQTGHAPPATWPGKAEHPVQGVTWDDAVAYCTWANKRLPAEAEWEAAARGPGPNPPLYPWGEDEDAGGKVNDLPRTQTYAVGTFSFNKSPTGVYDMAGNVWEWVGEPYVPVPEGMRILRGGRYGLIRDMAFRQPAESDSKRFVPFAGVRCAADQVQGG